MRRVDDDMESVDQLCSNDHSLVEVTSDAALACSLSVFE